MKLKYELQQSADCLHRSDDGGGPRDYLAGRPVYCGTCLRMWSGDDWIWVRYELAAGPARAAILYTGETEAVRANETHLLRWPESWES